MIDNPDRPTPPDHRQEADAETHADEQELHPGWVSLTDPDDPDGPPLYEGPSETAGELLVPGTYLGVDDDDRPVRVTVPFPASGAPAPPPAL